MRRNRFPSRKRPRIKLGAINSLIESLERRALLATNTPYQRVVIDQNPGGQPLEKTLLDIDGDGKMDAAIGHRDGTGIYWYQYPHSGVVTDHWNKYTIVNTGNCYEDTAARDVNGDGAVDLIASYNDQVVWFQNPRGSGGDPRTAPWTMHLIGATQAHDIAIGDLDGDGKFDIATNKTVYFQNSPTSWTGISTSNYSRTGDGVALLDTGHGKVDIVGTGPATTPHSIKWYENPRDHGGNARTDVWIMHTVGAVYDPNDPRGGLTYESADMNNDGRMDIVTAQNEQPDDFAPPPPVGVAWYEAPVDRVNGTWVRHQIDIGVTQVHRIRIADVDGDGTPDVFYAEQEQSANDRVGVFHNLGGTGLNWYNQVFSTSSGHNIFVADVDGDGDPDMLSSPHGVYGHPDPIELYVSLRNDQQQSAPKITTQPQSQTVGVGSSVTFSVVATGTAPLAYQWQRNNVDIPNATSASYTLASATLADSGSTFHVKVSNVLGSLTSNDATLTVANAVYLSDLTPTYAVSGWGPYERDKSNGEKAAGDGKTITLNGVQYSKGLGTNSVAELRYALNGGYDTFTSDVGIDDEVGSSGSVVFQVWDGLGNKLYDSGVMTGSSATKSVAVPVSGLNELRLIVTNGGNNINYDHADWAGAKLLKNTVASFAVNPLPAGNINEGSTYSGSGSFTDPGNGPWTATIDYGDGSGVAALTLNVDKSFSLSHVYADNGSYTVKVVVDNGTTQANNTGAVTVKNVSAIVSLGSGGNTGVHFTQAGSFADPGADTWTATADYGDGSGAQPLTLNADKTFTLDHVYVYNGTYPVKVTVLDDDNGSGSSTISINVTGGQNQPSVYLSDLTPTSATNGYGPYERDKSNGENAAGDGHTITLNGVQYTKGLGVHANSDIRYNLGAQYSSFTAAIGVDDEVGSNGSVVFQVYTDGTKVYDSGLMTGNTATKQVSVNTTGVNELRLVVTDSGNGFNYDHADWANAKVASGPGAAPGALPAPPPARTDPGSDPLDQLQPA